MKKNPRNCKNKIKKLKDIIQRREAEIQSCFKREEILQNEIRRLRWKLSQEL